MWVPTNVDLPPELDAKTMSTWLAPGIMIIGVMRESMMSPPYLWAQVLRGGFRNVRKAPALLDQLQELLFAPTVYAEAERHLSRNQDLLVYLGFHFVDELSDRRIYERSI